MRSFKVLGGQLTLFDGPEGYRPAEDSFWLSALLPTVPKGSTVLDLGCGTGAVILSYALRHTTLKLFGIEHNIPMAEAAIQASEANAIPLNVQIGDALNHTHSDAFTLSFANPPFYKQGREDLPQTADKTNVRQTSDLIAWLKALLKATKQGGYAALICHAADAEDLQALAPTLEASCIRLFYLKTSATKPPKRCVLVYQKQLDLPCSSQTLNTYEPELRQKALEKNLGLYS